MKKILLISIISTLFLSANSDNSTKKIDAIAKHTMFLQERSAKRAERTYLLAHKKTEKQIPRIKLEFLTAKLKSFESLDPDLKNKLNTDAQLQFVALFNVMAQI